MGSMNLLGFSLSSPQEHHHPSAAATHTHEEDHSHETSRFGLFNPDAAGDCFDLTTTTTTTTTSDHHHSTSTAHSLNHLPPFGIYEAFHRNNNNNNIQDWKQENEYNSQNFLLPTASCNNHQQQQQPKLENFLGGHSFGDHHSSTYGGNSASADHYMIHPNCSLQLPPHPEEATVGGGGGGDGGTGNTTNSIGLSMIKTWLRNQPPHSAENNNNNNESGSGSGGAPRVQQTLSLSMSTGSQSSSSLPLLTANNVSAGESSSSENKKPPPPPATAAALDSNQTGGAIVDSSNVPRKAIDTFGQRTSIYRGVTRHRWTGRYEAHLWDNSCRREGQTRKGRQVYLGGYDKEEKAARAYDLAALKYWGTTTTTNFPISHYEKELEEMKHMTRQEYVASLRRKSSGFSRGASIYRGVTRHHQHGRWQARIGRVAGNKDLYLGTFSTQEEAAEAYDVAAIKFRGLSAVTNFDMSRYDVKSILESSTLPIGGAAKRLKEMDHQLVEPLISVVDHGSHTTDQDQDSMSMSTNSHLSTEGILNNYHHGWHHHHHALAAFPQQPHPLTMHYPYGTQTHQRLWCKQEQDPDHTTFPDNIHQQQQLQLGNNNNNNTHNFFLSNSAGGLHSSLMSMDHSASSMDNSSASNSVSVYGGGDGSNGTYGGSGGSYVIPTVIANDGGNQIQNQRSNGYGDSDQLKAFGSYESVFGSATDPYHAGAAHARNNNYLYNYQQQSSVVDAVNKGSSTYEWVPTAIPTLAAPSRPNSNMSLCPPPFTILHE